MKKTIALFAMLIALTVAVQAQTKRDTIRNDKHTTAKVKKTDQLGLSKEQAKKWKEEKDAYKKSKDALKADKTLTKEQKREKEKTLSQQHTDKLAGILTPEQQAKYKTLKDEEKQEKAEKKKDKGKKKGQ